MTLASTSSLPSNADKFRSKLDPNVAPFAPSATSKTDNKGPTRNSSSSSVIYSVDSGCHSDKDETGISPPADGGSKAVNISALVDLKMKTGVEKFEEDSRGYQPRSTAGVTMPATSCSSSSSSTLSSYRSAFSSVASAASGGSGEKNQGDDSVFLPTKVHFPPLPTKKSNPSPPRSSSGNGLLPTPDDFPLFGPSQKKDCYNNGVGTEVDADQYGLRALVKGIVTQPNPLTTDPESRSHYSLAELGFPSDFRDGFFPKRHYFKSPYVNGPLTVIRAEGTVDQIPPEYRHGKDGTNKRLPKPNLMHFSSDLLFFLFYTAVEDQLQVQAACELFRRGWRFHKVKRIWLGRPDIATAQPQRNGASERGRYQFFDVNKWGRDYIENLTIKYEDVAGMDLPPGPPPHNLVPPPPPPRLTTPSQTQMPPPPVNQMQGPPPPYAMQQMMQYQHHRQVKMRAAAAAAAAAEQEVVQLQQHQQRLQMQQHQMAAAHHIYGNNFNQHHHQQHYEYVRY